VAAVAIVALQQRAVVLPSPPGTPVTAQNIAVAPGAGTSQLAGTATSAGTATGAGTAAGVGTGPGAGVMQVAAVGPGGAAQAPRETISYTVPPTSSAAPSAMAPARLTNYVLAHSRYSSGLEQRGVLADLLIEADEQQPVVSEAAAHVAP